MMRQQYATWTAVLLMVGAAGIAGCDRSEPEEGLSTPAVLEQPGAPAGTAPIGADMDIEFTSEPDPPVTGENTFEVTVRQADGTPVTDATVTAEFFMAAMPEMKMPEMRTTTPLTHQGEGRYRGTGQVTMAGPWDVTVAVERDGETIGRRTMQVTAK